MRILDLLLKALPIRQAYTAFMRGPSEGKVRTDALASVQEFRSWVFACVNRNAQTCAGFCPRLYIRGATRYFPTKDLSPERQKWLGEKYLQGQDASNCKEVLDHPILDLLRNPSEYYTRDETFDYLFAFLDLTGNAYFLKESEQIGDRKVTVRLWPLLAQYMTPVIDDEGEVKGWLYGKERNSRLAYTKQEIIHFRYFNPLDPIMGWGPMQAAAHPVGRLGSMNKWEAALWRNNARPDIMIKSDVQLNARQRKELSEDWYRLVGGEERAGRPVVLPAKLDVKEINFAPKDTNHLLFARFSREEIAAIFGVPMTMLEMSQASKAGASVGDSSYMAQTIYPRLCRVASKLTIGLAREFDERFLIAYDDPTPVNREQIVDEHVRYVQAGVYTPNMVLDKLGEPRHEWGDVPLPWISSVGKPDAEPPDAKPPDSGNGDQAGAAKDGHQLDQRRRLGGRKVVVDVSRETHSGTCTCGMCSVKGLAEPTPREAEMAKGMKAIWAQQQREVLDNLARAGKV